MLTVHGNDVDNALDTRKVRVGDDERRFFPLLRSCHAHRLSISSPPTPCLIASRPASPILTPTPPSIGVEVRSPIDLDDDLDDGTVVAASALRRWCVDKALVFRDQDISPVAWMSPSPAGSVSSRSTPSSRTTPTTPSSCCSAAPRRPRRARTSSTATSPGGQTPSMASLLRCVECRTSRWRHDLGEHGAGLRRTCPTR